MKKLLILPILAGMTGCNSSVTEWKTVPTVTNTYTRVTSPKGGQSFAIQDIDCLGHKYLIVQGGGLAAIHAAHCPCLNRPAPAPRGFSGQAIEVPAVVSPPLLSK